MSLLNNPFDPAHETALVTGAGNGIGRAIAQALVGEGVRTVFADVNADTVAAAAKNSPRPELAVPWVGNLADPAACDALLAAAQSALGRVTQLYGPAVRCKPNVKKWRGLVLRICIRPLHEAVELLAIMDIRAHPISFSERP